MKSCEACCSLCRHYGKCVKIPFAGLWHFVCRSCAREIASAWAVAERERLLAESKK